MDYQQFASDLPPHRTVMFSCAEENEETMRRNGVNQQVRQLGRGRFQADVAILESEEAVLFADRFSTALSISLEAPEGMVGLLFPRTATDQFQVNGKVANDNLVVFPRGSGADLMLPELAGSEAITIPESRFIELAKTISPTPSSALPEQLTAIAGNTERLDAIRNSVLELVAHPELDPLGERVANLVAATIAWMSHSAGDWRPDRFRSNGVRQRVAKLAQAFIEENYCNPIRSEDLCQVTGVGVRTLQRFFREYFDLTMTEYLKTIRLEAARRELAAAHASQCSVTTIAMQHGFGHLGRFSGEFHKRFGELPSETLKHDRAAVSVANGSDRRSSSNGPGKAIVAAR